MRTPALIVLLSLAACANAASPRLLGPPIKQGDVVDYSCRTAADCAVKDVGNCCGAYPACVNRASPTFPNRVKAECAQKHMAGTCGFPVIKGCACVDGRCSDVTGDAARPR
jgi:hypothetical protein